MPASAILSEDTGSNTLESLQHVRAILYAHGLHTALFVSDRSHMLRVLRLAQDLGIEAWASPTATSPDDIDPHLIFNSMVHELGALGLYAFVNEDPDSALAPDDSEVDPIDRARRPQPIVIRLAWPFDPVAATRERRAPPKGVRATGMPGEWRFRWRLTRSDAN